MRSKLLAAALALPMMVAAAGSAQANIIALVIDSSGSIGSGTFAQLKLDYISAINALVQPNGQNAFGVWQFSGSVQPIFSITTITTAADKLALTNAIAGMSYLNSTTAVGDALVSATSGITGFAAANYCKSGGVSTGKCIIDISTDGQNNDGTANPTTAANTAYNTYGIKVNCLGVGAADCSFNNAAGVGQDFPASSYASFEAVLRAKLTAELGLPEPVTMSLFGAGLLGAAALRRRKTKTA